MEKGETDHFERFHLFPQESEIAHFEQISPFSTMYPLRFFSC